MGIHKNIALLVAAFLLFLSGASYAGTIELPRTGQTTCYDESGNVVACLNTGQNGDNLAGISWPDPRFTDNSDGTITDNLTGLIWLKDANCLSGYWSTAISNANSLADGSCGLTDGSSAGDWRLPNINELESLFNAEEDDIAAWLNSQGFTNAVVGLYWSSTTAVYPINKCCAWSVTMFDGKVDGSSKDNTLWVWPVRAVTSTPAQIWKTGLTTCYDYALDDPIPCLPFTPGQDGEIQAGVSWPDPRFTDNGDGTITDNLTGLMWLKDANCFGASGQTWQEALNKVLDFNTNPGSHSCSDYTASLSDWRLPNRKELHSLVDRSQYNPALPSGQPFANSQSSSYWSATTYADSPLSAWKVSFLDGGMGVVLNANKNKSSLLVWPVRAGQTVPIVDPVPDIKANGSDGPITLGASETLSVSVSLAAGSSLGVNCDWWVAVSTPFAPPNDWYHYDLSLGWIPGLSFTYQGPLFDLAAFEVLSMSGLPEGTYTFYFAVDTNMNGILDTGTGLLYYDSMEVNVTSSSTGDISMITPYVNESDIRSIWLFNYSSHQGIDFQTTGNLRPFQAVSSGVVENIDLSPTEGTSNWQVSVDIRYNSTYAVLYGFEPMTPVQADGETQLTNISVSVGQAVSQGDIIGYLYAPNLEAHVHFGLFKYGTGVWDPLVCPEPYFTQEARDSILNLIHREYPDANICN